MLIEEYQQQYWDIIKRNNMFIQIAEIDSQIKQDRVDLNNLYKKVENAIDKNNNILKELKDLKEKYNKGIEKAQTQTEMNVLASHYLENTDKILNDVYIKIKENSSQTNFEALKTNEIEWVREQEEYQTFLEKQSFGSIFGLIYCKTMQDIKYFRTLLLIFYLEQIS